MEHEVVVRNRLLEVALQLHARDGGGVHLRLIEGEAPLPRRLGGVHGQVGLAQQVVGLGVAIGRDGGADAGPHHHLPALELERRAKRLEDPLGGAARPVLPRLLEQDRELVATEAGGRVLRAHHRPQSLGHRDQELVAGVVAEGVVDGLEVVEVGEED